MAREGKALLVGESTLESRSKSIRSLVEADEAFWAGPGPTDDAARTEEVLLNLAAEFREGLSVEEIIGAIGRVEDAVRSKHPEVGGSSSRSKLRDGTVHARDSELIDEHAP